MQTEQFPSLSYVEVSITQYFMGYTQYNYVQSVSSIELWKVNNSNVCC